ncbi:urease accessory protein UreF [Limosilactobacillus sp. STM2_1]|uniref:Urease accessory protein UreF n=1 Tax=Limosilactobacillus rudii TaxID=2759755 RepID=A0A7W3UMC7_9LACO|nr:urease accessory protein UreF [Limosilactobacillus rudii]MBB1080003.1 urease accessory protein UreF [Limosilactobacillus rudii]MBB1098136.1 urease accessory protein UreF [Limosilactobacillus rudii]MCD7135206.1 urease accessory protein UreF [Limosilactobacillus rudii]
MDKKLKDKLNYLEVFQICDSTFPIGTFNHSFGMENYLRTNVIKKAPEFRIWLENYYRSQFKYGEGLLVKLCYEAIDNGDFDKLVDYDDQITKSTLAIETRNGTKLIAHQMILLIQKLYGDDVPHLNEYQQAIDDGKAYGNPAIAFSIFAHYKKLPLMDAFLMYGYSVASTLVLNAVRAVPLGQKEGQVILNDLIKLIGKLYKHVEKLDDSFLGANAPGLEIAQINHEIQQSRLFMS